VCVCMFVRVSVCLRARVHVLARGRHCVHMLCRLLQRGSILCVAVPPCAVNRHNSWSCYAVHNGTNFHAERTSPCLWVAACDMVQKPTITCNTQQARTHGGDATMGAAFVGMPWTPAVNAMEMLIACARLHDNSG